MIVDCSPWHLPRLAYGCLPEKQQFDQGRMTNHLHDYLKNGVPTMFPIVKERTCKNRIKCIDKIPVFCNCRMPDDNSMVQCCECNQWYHVQCIDVPKAALEDNKEPWFCNYIEQYSTLLSF